MSKTGVAGEGPRPLKLLLVSSAPGWAGGEVYALRLALAMKDRGHTVTFACRRGSPLWNAMEGRNIPTLAAAPRNSADLLAVARLALALRFRGYDLIHGHVGRDYVPVALAGLLSRKPYVLTRHLLGSLSRYTVKAMSHAAAVVAVSNAVRRVLVDEMGVPASRVRALLAGIDLDRFHPQKGSRPILSSFGISDTAPVIGVVNQLHRGKRCDLLVRAASLLRQTHPEARTVIVGEGPERAALEAQIQQLHLEEEVRLLGFREDIDSLLPEFTLLALATDGEPFGLVVIEAMACGLPVVAAKAGGPAEIVRHQETGLLFPIGDEAAMAAALKELIEDPQKAAVMGQAGRQRAEEFFDQRRMMDEMEALYQSAI